jgi:uncharacterized protein (TIGR03790 family)
LVWAASAGAAVEFPVVPDEAERVVIVANENDPESVQLARYYADKREIPRANIMVFDLPAGEEITWQQFLDRLYLPLQQRLIEDGWLEAIEMDLHDDVGRRKVSTAGHRISYLVTCRGVPLKIRASSDIPADGPENMSSKLRTNRAAVDSELALINRNAPQRDGFVRNPVFGKPAPGMFEVDSVVRVSRLDGPTYPMARRLVESALTAETQGLIGRAIVDIGGPHKRGDQWFGEAAEILGGLGWAPQVDRGKASLPATARADGVAIYLGWYAGKINGPFTDPGFQFAPGAIALHLHSYSAASLRLRNGGGWTGPLVARGVAATVGNVYEPYLEFTHHPQMFIGALLSGATLGEAAYFSMPVLSWQGVVVGDPLYRPGTVSVMEQLEHIEELPRRWASYLLLRQVRASQQAEGEALEAEIVAAKAAFDRAPTLALAWAVAQLQAQAGNIPGAVNQLGMAGFLRRVRVDEWGLLAQIADQLEGWEDTVGAAKVWKVLVNQPLPAGLQRQWLPRAIAAAKAAGDFSNVVTWETTLRRLNAPPEKEQAKKN